MYLFLGTTNNRFISCLVAYSSGAPTDTFCIIKSYIFSLENIHGWLFLQIYFCLDLAYLQHRNVQYTICVMHDDHITWNNITHFYKYYVTSHNSIWVNKLIFTITFYQYFIPLKFIPLRHHSIFTINNYQYQYKNS